jgi:hypothetical protein
MSEEAWMQEEKYIIEGKPKRKGGMRKRKKRVNTFELNIFF